MRALAATVVGALVLAGAAGAASSKAPVLRVSGQTLAGAGFKANATVSVAVNGLERSVLRTNARGSFVVTLPVLRFLRCRAATISAAGAAGRATVVAPSLKTCLTREPIRRNPGIEPPVSGS